MNKAVPWRIKGVAFDAREAAIEAARRSGMSLGEWLNTVIEEQAHEEGRNEDDLDADDRLQAVSRRLSSLRDDGDMRERPDRKRSAPQRHRPSPNDDFDAPPRPNRTSRQDAFHEPRRDSSPSPKAQRASRPEPLHAPIQEPRQDFDAEHLLENAIAAFDRRAHRASERTARALSEVAELLDVGHRERARDDEALASIADRLTGIERRVADGTAPKADNAVRDALARLERRMDTLSHNAARPAPQTERPVRVAQPMPQAAPNGAKRPLAAAIAEVARRQQELDGFEAPAARIAPAARTHGFVAPAVVTVPTSIVGSAAVAVAPATVPVPPPATPLAPTGPSPLELRLAALVERLEKSANAPKEPPQASPRIEFSGLEGHISTLADRIETMRSELAARPTPAATPRSSDGVADIRRELQAMTRAVADLAPHSSVAALEMSVRDLSARVADSRIDGAGDAALAPVESLVRELLGVVRSADPRPAIESLDRGIRAVATKLENFSGITVSDPEAAREVAEQTRAMRDSLARLAEKQIPAERIERGLADLSARVESIASAGVDPLGRGEMAQRVGEIRAMLSDPVAQERTLQTLEKRLEEIAGRIDAMFGERLDTMQRDFAAQMNARPEAPDVENLVNDLGTRLDNALSSGLKAMERTVARLVETNGARTEEPATRLEEMVRELSARIDASTAAAPNSDALDGVQQQIAKLAEHFDHSDRMSETLVALQKSVSDLFARIEQSQDIAIQAAEAAARVAAAEASNHGAEASPELVREVADLRMLQNTADHRTHATLSAVHDTLSQVVQRLSSLEDDFADTRHEPTPAREPIPFRATRTTATDTRELEEATVDDEIFIEPGAGFDRRPGAARSADDRAEMRPQASFIQAARRAAQAAQTPGDDAPREKREKPAAKRAAASEEKTGNAPLDTVRAYYASRKRPILLSLAALMVIFGAWQVAKVATEDKHPTATSSLAPTPAPVREKIAEKPAALPKVETAAAAPTIETAPASAARATTLPATETPPPPATATAPTPAIDRTPVGTLGTPTMPVDTNGIVRALAVSGDSAAQYELAVRYADGKLLARDLKSSKEWFEKAAAKGVVPAQYRLGALYERGIGIPKDSAQARGWYQRAAEAGNARAMHNLAVLYADTTDGKPNYAEAITWFKRASELGVKDSQFNLAILYVRGLGTAANMTEAYQWFAAAAAQGDEDAAKKRDDVGGRLQPNDLARAKALAAAYKPKTLDAAANEVAPPPGGWESMKAPPRPDAKTSSRPKISAL